MSYNYVQSSVKQAFNKSLQMWNFPGGAQVYNLNLRHCASALQPHQSSPCPHQPSTEIGPLGELAESSGVTLGCGSHQVHPGYISRTE